MWVEHAWVILSTLDLKIRCHDIVSVKVYIVSVKNEKGDILGTVGALHFKTSFMAWGIPLK